MFQILKNPNYFRFWLGQIISQLGDGITRVAIVYLVATLSKDPLAIGLVIFAQLLPTAFFGIFLGPLADKYNRKWLMTAADLYRMAIVLLMIPFHGSALALIVLIAFQGLGSALFDPARASSIPELVGEDKIQEATSLSQSTRAAMDIIGPSIGALLMVSKNFDMIFAIDAATFALSAMFILTLKSLGKIHSKTPAQSEKYFSSLTSGIREVTRMPLLRFLLILLMPITLVIGVLNTNLIAVLTNTFQVSAFHFGFIEASLAIGVILGAAVVGPLFLKKMKPGTILLTGTAAIGIWMVLIIPLDFLRVEYGVVPIYVWCIMVGILNAFINVPLSSLFLKATPAPFQGRGSSLLGLTASSFQIAGILIGGWIGREIGVLYGTALAGSLLIVVSAMLPLLKGYKSLSENRKPESVPETQPVAAN
ncbi:MFS transporter [Neobacillus sp. PS3-34]|uniref:MFS transporter n=1 Tax=Neobacillus sp. PS3-34 TaxID=3070678 RepID=UPI0027E11EE4|nr:MFS transporter [Neobacillus sp. PS3-34]WML47112.1 MFS transporter [Neobacillus sp. PS3-34]